MHYSRAMENGDPHIVKLKRHGKPKGDYNAWHAMVRRCTDPADPHFANYGGRGITVCDRWHDFKVFYADMGARQPGMTLERVDNELGYSPENCIWPTRAAQQRNRRCNRLTIEDARAIRSRCRTGGSQKSIADSYGLAPGYVSQIVSFKIWREEPIRSPT